MAVTLRRAATMAAPIGIALVTPAHAATTEINTADAAWMIVATALVLMMTIPGLALFFSGMVRNVVHLSAGTGTQRFLIQL